jgi:hypothetical protein
MPNRKEEKIKVRITIEYLGNVKKGELMAFHSGLGSTLDNHMENGGGGPEFEEFVKKLASALPAKRP